MSNEKNGIDVYGKGLRYFKSGDLIKAGDCFSEAIQLLPPKSYGASLVWASWGDLFKVAEMYDNAKDSYIRAINADETNDDAYIELIKFLTEINQFEEAIHYINKYLVNFPNDDFAWSHKGALLNILNRTSEAKVCLKRAQQLNPQNPQVLMLKDELGL